MCECVRSSAQAIFGHYLGFAEVGFIQLAVGVAVRDPVVLPTLLAFLARREVTG